jgi:hypothetical protein
MEYQDTLIRESKVKSKLNSFFNCSFK